jgi:hypothetical protein
MICVAHRRNFRSDAWSLSLTRRQCDFRTSLKAMRTASEQIPRIQAGISGFVLPVLADCA